MVLELPVGREVKVAFAGEAKRKKEGPSCMTHMVVADFHDFEKDFLLSASFDLAVLPGVYSEAIWIFSVESTPPEFFSCRLM